MDGTATRYLYLARHAEASPDGGAEAGVDVDAVGEAVGEADGGGLTPNGRRQADLLGRRLRGLPIRLLHHGPLPRAAQTAQLVAAHLDGVTPQVAQAAGDYLPYLPRRDELPPESAESLMRFLARPTVEQHRPELAREAVSRFTGPVPGDQERHELLITHGFLIGWLIRHALDAPGWRWLGLDHTNAALTVLRYTPGLPPALVTYNDTAHLPGTPPQRPGGLTVRRERIRRSGGLWFRLVELTARQGGRE